MRPRSALSFLSGILALASVIIATRMVAQTPTNSSGTTPLRVVIIGDSTVCNYPQDHPNRGWGMYLGERFKDGEVSVINLAASGRSTKTFISEGRWQKALEEKPNIVLIQFGHNDSHSPDKPEATDAASDYKANLHRYIDESRAIGATPVLITPMVRRTFDASGKISPALSIANKAPESGRDLSLYANAMREVGKEMNAPVIDLYTSSKQFAEKLGPVASLELANKKGDSTHFNEKGARAMLDLIMIELPSTDPRIKAALKTS